MVSLLGKENVMNNFVTYKINLKLVRSFSFGFTIYSPTLNGLCFEIKLGVFSLMVWSKGKHLIGFSNYWVKQY